MSPLRVDRRLVKRIVGVGVVAFLFGYLLVALVMFVTSSHPDVVTVPDVRSVDVAAATRRLRDADLTLAVGDTLPNPTVPAGVIVAQSPLPGQEVGPGTEVSVIVSTGAERHPVPDVRVLARDQAVSILTSLGFQVEVQEVPDVRAAGRILGTEPAAGTPLSTPAVVRLVVSSGPPRVPVPDVVGMQIAAARAALDGAGLETGSVEEEYRPEMEEGQVVRQDPAAGDSARVGSRVDLVAATRLLGVPAQTLAP